MNGIVVDLTKLPDERPSNEDFTRMLRRSAEAMERMRYLFDTLADDIEDETLDEEEEKKKTQSLAATCRTLAPALQSLDHQLLIWANFDYLRDCKIQYEASQITPDAIIGGDDTEREGSTDGQED